MRRKTNIFVYVIARILTGLLSFLGFRGPAWARAAVGGRRAEPAAPSSSEETSPAVARAVAAAGPNASAKKRAPSRKTAARTRLTSKKIAATKTASKRTARERTGSLRSSL